MNYTVKPQPIRVIPLLAGILLGLLLLLTRFSPVLAQCGQPTTCTTCHEVQGQLSVRENGQWHTSHTPYNACHLCHGGDKTARDPAVAHAGVVTSLDAMQSGCNACHPGDLQDRYKVYADQVGVSSEINPANLKSSSTEAGIGRLFGNGAGPGLTMSTSTQSAAPPTNSTGNLIVGGLFLLTLLGGTAYIIWNERRLMKKASASNPWWRLLWSKVRQENWSPYAAGILLGLVGILAVVYGNHLLSASSAIATLSSALYNAVAPQAASQNMYFTFIYPPSFNWPLALMIGIFLGGMVAALSSRTFRLRWNDDPTWRKVFGPSRLKRLILGYLGAIILQFGASIAGGCTSGLAISGGMLLAPSAFLFMAGMFASGIILAILIYRRKY